MHTCNDEQPDELEDDFEGELQEEYEEYEEYEEEEEEEEEEGDEEEEVSDPDAVLQQRRARLDYKLKSTFEAIFEKYGQDFEGVGDEIDLETGDIVVNNGHLLEMQDERDAGNTSRRNLLRDYTEEPDDTDDIPTSSLEETEVLDDEDDDEEDEVLSEDEEMMEDDLILRGFAKANRFVQASPELGPSRIAVPPQRDPRPAALTRPTVRGNALPSRTDILAQFGPQLGPQIVDFVSQHHVPNDTHIEPAWRIPELPSFVPTKRPTIKRATLAPEIERSPSPEASRSVWAPAGTRGPRKSKGSPIFRRESMMPVPRQQITPTSDVDSPQKEILPMLSSVHTTSVGDISSSYKASTLAPSRPRGRPRKNGSGVAAISTGANIIHDRHKGDHVPVDTRYSGHKGNVSQPANKRRRIDTPKNSARQKSQDLSQRPPTSTTPKSFQYLDRKWAGSEPAATSSCAQNCDESAESFAEDDANLTEESEADQVLCNRSLDSHGTQPGSTKFKEINNGKAHLQSVPHARTAQAKKKSSAGKGLGKENTHMSTSSQRKPDRPQLATSVAIKCDLDHTQARSVLKIDVKPMPQRRHEPTSGRTPTHSVLIVHKKTRGKIWLNAGPCPHGCEPDLYLYGRLDGDKYSGVTEHIQRSHRAPYPCTELGCSEGFFRPFALEKHKTKHKKTKQTKTKQKKTKHKTKHPLLSPAMIPEEGPSFDNDSEDELALG
jgi:hypothetical protein